MSGVVSKMTCLPRARSFSLPSSINRSNPIRRFHGSILHPRGSKIRHLNASHTLLVDLDRHIAKVQELEVKVWEMELQLQQREALKAELAKSLPDLQDKSLKTCLVTEEDRIAFQNRLLEAKRRADELSRKTSLEENNILRSWHSKRLKDVLDSMNDNSVVQLKFLPTPSQIDEEDNNIFNCLNSLVDVANDQSACMFGSSSNSSVEVLKALIIERENLKQCLENTRLKLGKSDEVREECNQSIHNIQNSMAALHLQIQSSQYYLGSILRKENTNSIWIYGPNPIFSRMREVEINSSFENQFVAEILKKMEISRLHAETNLALTQTITRRYKKRLNKISSRLQETNSRIENQVELVTMENESAHIKVLETVCDKAEVTHVNNNCNINNSSELKMEE